MYRCWGWRCRSSGGPSADESTRVIRLWTVSAVTPLEKALVWCQNGLGGIWSNYVYLRGVRQENRELKFEIERLRLEQVRLSDDAQQARRLQALLGFKEQYIAKTVAAQVIGSSGSEQSRSIYIDKGTSAGVEKDMAVITADGLVGKVLRAYRVLGAGAPDQRPEQRSGCHPGQVAPAGSHQGDGGRRSDPGKGDDRRTGDAGRTDRDQRRRPDLSQGHYGRDGDEGVTPGADLFLNIRVKPSANLSRLEEVLVITKKEDRAPSVAETNSVRAVDILTQRLPSVPDKPAADASQPAATEGPATPSGKTRQSGQSPAFPPSLGRQAGDRA